MFFLVLQRLIILCRRSINKFPPILKRTYITNIRPVLSGPFTVGTRVRYIDPRDTSWQIPTMRQFLNEELDVDFLVLLTPVRGEYSLPFINSLLESHNAREGFRIVEEGADVRYTACKDTVIHEGHEDFKKLFVVLITSSMEHNSKSTAGACFIFFVSLSQAHLRVFWIQYQWLIQPY